MVNFDFDITSECANNTHWTLAVSFDGRALEPFQFHIDEVRGAPDDEEIRDAVIVMLRVLGTGKTRAQIRGALNGRRMVVGTEARP